MTLERLEEKRIMELRLVLYPDPILRKVARPITEREIADGRIDGTPIPQLAESLLDLMRREKGVGLAAPQAGLSIRMFVVDIGKEGNGPIVAVNPEIVESSGRVVSEEGCLSFPGIRGDVRRHTSVVMRCLDEKGEPVEHKATGLLARAFEHEYDHLEGALLVDRLSSARKLFLRRDLRRLEEEYRERLAAARGPRPQGVTRP